MQNQKMESIILQKVRRYHELRNERIKMEKSIEAVKREEKLLQAEIWDSMETLGISQIKSPSLGLSITRKETVYAHVLDMEKFREWCIKEGLEDVMFKEQVQAGRLNQLVREKLQKRENLPDGVDFYPSRYISLTSEQEKAQISEKEVY